MIKVEGEINSALSTLKGKQKRIKEYSTSDLYIFKMAGCTFSVYGNRRTSVSKMYLIKGKLRSTEGEDKLCNKKPVPNSYS